MFNLMRMPPGNQKYHNYYSWPVALLTFAYCPDAGYLTDEGQRKRRSNLRIRPVASSRAQMTWLHRVESAAAFAAWTQSLESWRFHLSPCFHCSEISAEMIKHDLSMQMVSRFISTNSTCHTDPQMQMLACFRTPCFEVGKQMAQRRLCRRRLMIHGESCSAVLGN